jgi:hypothetical protein
MCGFEPDAGEGRHVSEIDPDTRLMKRHDLDTTEPVTALRGNAFPTPARPCADLVAFRALGSNYETRHEG